MPPAFGQLVTFLDTRDLPATITFYERLLGLRLARDQGRCRIYHIAAGAYLGFCERGGGPGETGDGGTVGSRGGAADHASRPGHVQAAHEVVLTFVTDQVDGWFAHLTAHGAPVVKAPADNPPYRIYNAFVRDPNGYLVEIQRFWEPLA